MPNQILQLDKPLAGGKGTIITQFEFREPTFEDVMTFGEPTMPLSIGGDRYLPTPVPAVVKSYAERLLVNGDPNIMAGAGLKDAMAIQEIVLGFFRDAGPSPKSDESPAS